MLAWEHNSRGVGLVTTFVSGHMNMVNYKTMFLHFSLFFYSVDSFWLPVDIFSRFDELHYARYVSLYMKKTFYYDSQPPLGTMLMALAGRPSSCIRKNHNRYKMSRLLLNFNLFLWIPFNKFPETKQWLEKWFRTTKVGNRALANTALFTFITLEF